MVGKISPHTRKTVQLAKSKLLFKRTVKTENTNGNKTLQIEKYFV